MAFHGLRYAAPLSETQPCSGIGGWLGPFSDMARFDAQQPAASAEFRRPGGAGVAARRADPAAAVLGPDRRDAARHRRRHAAGRNAGLARRPGLVRHAYWPGAAAHRL